jgi:hypothetical protein
MKIITPAIGLHVGGERTRVEKKEVDEVILPRFLRQIQSKCNKKDTACSKLDISCRSWPYDSLQHFFEQLQNLPYHGSSSTSPSTLLSHIKVLNVDDVIASLLTEEGLQCMEYISNLFARSSCSLVEFDCSFNAIGSRGVEKLQSLLRTPSLRRIYMDNCGLSAEVGQKLNDILHPVSHTLQVLHLDRNQMGVQGCMEIIPLLSNCTSLQSFSYAGNRPLKEGTRALCQGLANMVQNSYEKSANEEVVTPPVLSFLNLEDCQINSGKDDPDDPIHVLCSQVLNRCTYLITLILRDCNLQAHGLQMVCNALSMSRVSLQHFDVGANEIGPSGAHTLTEYVSQSQFTTRLQTLICDTNDLDNASCIDVLCTNLLQSSSSIQYINIQCNDITDLSSLCHIVPSRHRQHLFPCSKEKIIIDLHENNELKLGHVRRIEKIIGYQHSISLLYDVDDLDDDEDDDEHENDGVFNDNEDDNDDSDQKSDCFDEKVNDQLAAMMSNVHIAS